MAWSAPPTWSVSQVVTAAQMTVLSDDLNYLKGSAGAITLDSSVTVSTASAPAFNVTTTSGSNKRGSFNFYQSGTLLYQFGSDLSNNNTRDFFLYDGVAGVIRLMLDANGNVGFGTSAPAGRLHAAGAGGGMLFLSCNAVDGTLQTPAIAGTVTQFAQFWGVDRNNTGGATVAISGNMISTLGGTFVVTNTDQVTVAVTAGGAITVQRTTGTNGTHQLNFMVLFK